MTMACSWARQREGGSGSVSLKETKNRPLRLTKSGTASRMKVKTGQQRAKTKPKSWVAKDRKRVETL